MARRTASESLSTATMVVAGGITLNNYNTVEIENGTLAVNGSYTMRTNATLYCALGGTNVGTGYGRLQVDGTAALNGGLRVSLANRFVPASDDVFTVVTAGTRNGTFANLLYPSNTSYRVEFKTDLALTNWTGLPGDILSVSNTASKLDALTPSNCFYRVRP